MDSKTLRLGSSQTRSGGLQPMEVAARSSLRPPHFPARTVFWADRERFVIPLADNFANRGDVDMPQTDSESVTRCSQAHRPILNRARWPGLVPLFANEQLPEFQGGEGTCSLESRWFVGRQKPPPSMRDG